MECNGCPTGLEIPADAVIGLLWRAAREDSKDAAEWLVEEFNITQYDARSLDNLALREACAAGHLDMAAWIASTFDLFDPADGRTCDNEILRTACATGEVDVAEWVAETYGLTTDDARARSNEALVGACCRGDAQLVEWLIGRFGLERSDVVDAIEVAGQNGHTNLGTMLAAMFGIDSPGQFESTPPEG